MLKDRREVYISNSTILVCEVVFEVIIILSNSVFTSSAKIRQREQSAGVILWIPFYKFDFIATQQIGIQDNRVMGIENQLRVINIDLIVVEEVQDIHKSNGMNRSIKFVNDQCCTGLKGTDDKREEVNKTNGAVGFEYLCR